MSEKANSQVTQSVSNVLDGRESFDATVGNTLIAFMNRNVTPYPTEVGAPSFELIPVEKQKDIMVNVARMHAQQEYDRIMQLVTVLQQQAQQIKRRLDITDWVHQAKYQFQIAHGKCYWLANDLRNGGTLLTSLGPLDWCTGVPDNYQYLCRVKWMGDYTWIEVDEAGNPLP